MEHFPCAFHSSDTQICTWKVRLICQSTVCFFMTVVVRESMFLQTFFSTDGAQLLSLPDKCHRSIHIPYTGCCTAIQVKCSFHCPGLATLYIIIFHLISYSTKICKSQQYAPGVIPFF